jgi:hypothetical protein
MRDRLLGMYQVKPVLGKLRGTLLGAGALLAASAVALAALISAGADADGVYGAFLAAAACLPHCLLH